MAKKPTVTTLASGFNSTDVLNTNFENLKEGFDNTLSLDGSTPNAMEADLDLNGNNLIGAVGLLINGTDYLADVNTAKTAAQNAQTAAETAKTNAETSETNAQAAQTAAETAKTSAETAETNAAASATTATTKASESASSATDAGVAKAGAETARDAAVVAKNAAEAVDVITDATVSVTTLSTGSSATASVTATNGTGAFSFGIPTGATGPQGIQGLTGLAGADGADGADADTSNLLPKAGGTMTGDLDFGDGVKAKFGDSDDLQVFHSAGNSFVQDAGAGDLFIAGSNAVRITNSNASEAYAAFNLNSGVDLYHDNTLRFQTSSTGISVAGNVFVTGTVDGVDIATRDGVLTTTTTTADAALPKAGGTMTGNVNLEVYHNGTDSFIDEKGSGWLYIRGNNAIIGKYTGETYMKGIADGAVELYHDNVKKIETTATGATITGNVTVSGTVDGRDIATNIPSSLGTAGQVLTVNAGATAGEWADAGGGGGITTGKAIAMAMVFG